MNSHQRAIWANNNFKTAEEKLSRGECSMEYVEKAEEIKADAEFYAHYNSKEGRAWRKANPGK